MKNKKTLRNFLIGTGAIGLLALGNLTKNTETFVGTMKEPHQICNQVIYGFDIGEEKLKYVEGVPQGLEKNKTYEVTIKDRYLLPDKIKYKELK